MSCRDEVLTCARQLVAQRGVNRFTVEDILHTARLRGTPLKESTIRTHVTSVMCVNAPANHATRYPDLERIGRGTYRLL